MQTVCELRTFRRAAGEAGMTAEEVEILVDYLARNPMAGDEMKGTGGCRKVRVAGRGKGKSGGYRVITFFTGDHLPVFLITVFGKGERANLSKRECNQLAALTATLSEEYRSRVVVMGAGA